MNSIQEIVELLDELSPEDRTEVFNLYCVHCGDSDPWCQCSNEE